MKNLLLPVLAIVLLASCTKTENNDIRKGTYKMISRTVHKHTPENQLDHDVFSAFQLSKKKLNHSQVKKVLYINDLPNYT